MKTEPGEPKKKGIEEIGEGELYYTESKRIAKPLKIMTHIENKKRQLIKSPETSNN